MLSPHRYRSLLLMLCGFIALLLMSSGATLRAYAPVTVQSSDMVQHAEATSANPCGWQKACADESLGDALAVDSDSDDESPLPSSVRIELDDSRPDAPLSANASFYLVPAASLLRPPRIA